MENKSLLFLIKSDLYRYHGRISLILLLKSLLFTKGFKFTFWMRLSKKYKSTPLINIIFRIFHYYYKRSYSSDIGYKHKIGYGFSIYHVFGTAFSEGVEIGNNVTITHNVTLGHINGNSPKILDNVYIGPGASVLGGITIGNNVVIGSNTVVTKDIPDNSTVIGNPSRIISSTPNNTTNTYLYR